MSIASGLPVRLMVVFLVASLTGAGCVDSASDSEHPDAGPGSSLGSEPDAGGPAAVDSDAGADSNASGPGWRLTFHDEFNGAEEAIGQGDDPDCYSTKPICARSYLSPDECENVTSEALPGLAGLNKCTWTVLAHYNWMDEDAPLDQRINAFSPSMVEVKDGYLDLKARSATYPEGFDCGEPLAPGQENSKTSWGTRCPIISGGLLSYPNSKATGFSQTYGRFEVRAKLPDGPGSWPAHWLLPVEGKWPDDGEIDIMEYWSHNPSKVAGNFHTASEGTGEHISKGKDVDDPAGRSGTWSLDFHVYAVEWSPDEIRYYVDDRMYLEVKRDQLIKWKGDWRYPDYPFYWILNTTVAPFANHEEYSPLYNEFRDLDHLIDYVRVYERCDLSEEGCHELELPTLDEPSCPLLVKYLGLYDDGRAVCRAFPNVSISEDSCLDLGRPVWRGYCLRADGSRYTARELE